MKKTFVLAVVMLFVAGMVVGYFLPRDIRTQLIKESGDYVRYKELAQDVLYPFNETDVVSMTMSGGIIKVNHTVEGGDHNFKFYEMGIDGSGFWRYLTQWK